MGEQRMQNEEPAVGVPPQRLPLRIDRQFGGDRQFDLGLNQLRNASAPRRPAAVSSCLPAEERIVVGAAGGIDAQIVVIADHHQHRWPLRCCQFGQ